MVNMQNVVPEQDWRSWDAPADCWVRVVGQRIPFVCNKAGKEYVHVDECTVLMNVRKYAILQLYRLQQLQQVPPVPFPQQL